jgi:DNA-binding NtrC family response regulator
MSRSARPHEEPPEVPQFLGRSPAARALRELVDRVAVSDTTVLISGETGAGKSLVARRLHALSSRAAAPFTVIHCASISHRPLEDEVRRIIETDGGTLLFDDVGELPPAEQAHLVCLLQERAINGPRRSQPLDLRFLAATRQDLESLVKTGGFRQDLYFRLNALPMAVPALRDRREDIPLLAEHLLGLATRSAGRPLTLSPEAVLALQMYPWPGNVRELEHLMHRVALLDRDGVVGMDDLPANLLSRAERAVEVMNAVLGQRVDLAQAVDQFEWTIVERVLKQTGGNRAKAAAALGIGRTTLIDKIRKRSRQGR